MVSQPLRCFSATSLANTLLHRTVAAQPPVAPRLPVSRGAVRSQMSASSSPHRSSLVVPCALGCPLHLYTAVFRADGPIVPFIVELMLWSCFPYAITALLPDLRIRSERHGVFARL